LHLNKGQLSNSPSKNNSEPKLETTFFSKMTAPVTLVSEMVNPDQNNEILRGVTSVSESVVSDQINGISSAGISSNSSLKKKAKKHVRKIYQFLAIIIVTILIFAFLFILYIIL
jgi:hypothetical protein